MRYLALTGALLLPPLQKTVNRRKEGRFNAVFGFNRSVVA
jgi:hypothetical protein